MAKIPIILESGRADGKLIKSNSVYDDNQEKFLSDKLEEIDNNHNTLNNIVNSLADEEDITKNTDGKLQFKNKEYGDGMGYIILRKNKSFAEQVTKENTIYEIRYNFDLGGSTLSIPNGCTLLFLGGKLLNGTIIGKYTKVVFGGVYACFGDVVIDGTFDTTYVDSMMFDTYDEQALKNIMSLANGNVYTFVNVHYASINIKGYLDGNIDLNDGHSKHLQVIENCIKVPSKTKINFNGGTLNIIPNERYYYVGLGIVNSHNVIIENVNISGDASTHSIGEYGFGIDICGSKNVKLYNCVSYRTSGDGFIISPYYSKDFSTFVISENVTLHKCKADQCRRQGLSIIYGYNIDVFNCEFVNIATLNGTAPMCGIDLEPNNWPEADVLLNNTSIANINIVNCKFNNNKGRDIDTIAYASVPTIKEVNIKDCIFTKPLRLTSHVSEVLVENCNMTTAVLSFHRGSVRNNKIDGYFYLDGAPDEVVYEGNVVVADYNKTLYVYGQGICINNNADTDLGNVIFRNNKFYLKNFDAQSVFYGLQPICRVEASWDNWKIKRFPIFEGNIFDSDGRPIYISVGGDFINNKVFNCSGVCLVKATDTSKFTLLANTFISKSSSCRVEQAYSNPFSETDVIVFIHNKMYGQTDSNIFGPMTNTSPQIDDYNTTYNGMVCNPRALSGWTYNKKGGIGSYYFDKSTSTHIPIFFDGTNWVDAAGNLK